MDQRTIKTYDIVALSYDEETVGFWDAFPNDFLSSFVSEIAVGGSILDLGSGPGRDGLLLQSRGFKVNCVDASAEMVRLSSERGLTSIQADFMALPFEGGVFDALWAYTSLLHIPKSDIKKALAEASRVLKPGGIFGLGMIEGEGEGYRDSAGEGLSRYFAYYTKEELESLLIEMGFTIQSFYIFKPGSRNYLNFVAKK